MFSEQVWERAKKAIRIAYANITDREFAQFILMAKSLPDFDCTDHLSTITAKCLVLGSSGDRVIASEAMEKLAGLLGCESYFYDSRYGHAVYDEAEDYVQRLLEFCRR